MYFRGSVIMSAISAIDIALWDIKGKALGVPVYELLGGKTREKVRVYASVMHLTEDNNELAKQYQQLQEMGFTAAKIFCNGPVSAPDGKGEIHGTQEILVKILNTERIFSDQVICKLFNGCCCGL